MAIGLTRTIEVSDEVYQLLKRSKRPSESFSMVVGRILGKGKLADIAGTAILSKKDWAATKRMMEEAEGLDRKKLAGFRVP